MFGSQKRYRRSDQGLLRSIIGIAIALALFQGVFALFWRPGPVIVVLPWYLPAVESFGILACLSIAFLAFGRYRVVREPTPFWIGLTFSLYAVLSLLYILSFPGLLPGERGIIALLPNTSAWVGSIRSSTVAILLWAVVVAPWPQPGMRGERRWLWLALATLMAAIVLAGLLVAFEQHLPLLIIDGQYTPLLIGWLCANAIALGTSAVLSAYRYQETGNLLLGYASLTAVLYAFALAAAAVGGGRYTLLWYWLYVPLVGSLTAMLFGLLSEYVGLFQRERRALNDLRAVLDATESGIMMYDRDLLIRVLNRRMTDWFDLDPAQVIGQPVNVVWRDYVAPKLDQPAKLLALFKRLVEHPEETILEEVEIVSPEYRVLRLYIGPVRANGERIGYIDVYTDITEIRRREEERQALGRIAEALVGEVELERVADVVVEQAKRVLRTSTVGLFLADLQREELRLIAHRGFSAQTVAEIGIAPFDATLLSALAARTGKLQTVCDITTLGPELTLARRVAEREAQRSLFSQPLFAKGRLVGVVTLAKPVHHHLTQWEYEFLRAFADLCAVAVENARLYEEVRETLHLREEFLSAAAHELKTPLAPLRGYAQLLLRSKEARPSDERQALEVIERQTRRITRLAEDLLETVSPSATPLELRRVDLASLAEEEVQEATQASDRHRLMLCRPGPVFVDVDPVLIRRVLLTLLDNAIRFSPQGGWIEVTVTPEDGMTLVSVRDHGLGIPKERQRHVFEPFYEPFPAGAPGYYGATGLGLFVVKTIVERHGGRTWFESEEGKGSTFCFSLPVEKRDSIAD
ncbi:MAG: GAF domain-containing protein [Chloroflexota bacterium]|nr:MAG: GAF domain-containing protein [Chloroflexota bacterium]